MLNKIKCAETSYMRTDDLRPREQYVRGNGGRHDMRECEGQTVEGEMK